MSADLNLLPCPFCGGVPRSGWNGSGPTGDDGYFGIDCCNAFAHGDDSAHAAVQWNTRAQPAATPVAAQKAESSNELAAFEAWEKDAPVVTPFAAWNAGRAVVPVAAQLDSADGAKVAKWKRDSELLDAVCASNWDVRWISQHNGEDYDIGLEIVAHFMAAPHERVIGENGHEDLRAALEQALTADPYPPARPEYDKHGRPTAGRSDVDEEEDEDDDG